MSKIVKNSTKKTNKKKAKWFKHFSFKHIILPLIPILLGSGVGVGIIINNQAGKIEVQFTSTYKVAEEPQPVQVEYGLGEITDEIPTFEYVESTSPVVEINDECPETEECGRGSIPTLNISSPEAFAKDVLNRCIDIDGYFGSQCWDEMAAYFLNYVGRTLTTCGSGAAKGTIQDGCWQKNAGNEFVMVWNKEEIQPGDIAVYSTGQWGHIGMAMGYYNNGYFTLLGQNQGGAACPGGGAAGNIINLSTRDFIGAFRPKIYIKPEPIPVSGCTIWHVEKGDTMSKVMMECEGTIKYGAIMNEYADTWYSLIVKPGQSVYQGWASPSGVGLYENDDIEHRI